MKKIFSFIIICALVLVAYDYFRMENDKQKTEETIKYEEYVETPEVKEPEPEFEPEVKPEEVENQYESLPEPVEINVDFDVTVNKDNSFNISTNLPDETELSLTLKGRGYLAQGKAYVKNGVGRSECFTDQGYPLKGEFELKVLMPIPNVQTDYVKHFIGRRGEYLTGPYIKGALGSVVAEKTFNVSLPGNN